MSVQDKLSGTGPKKLLALDGGGIRGIITLEVLLAMERQLQQALGRDDSFVLADYFDYIAGTSTGAIIASLLSTGMRVARIREFYLDSGKDMFDRPSLLQRLRYQYNSEPIARRLKQELGEDTLLGSDRLKTLLLMIMRNASTDSPWPISNNPYAYYNDRNLPDCNLNFPLWQLVRASTAAPVFFPPEVITVGDQAFIFVDGGVTMYNNPAFILFLMATTEPYRLMWPTGEDKMLLISIGTGTASGANLELDPGAMNLIYNATSIPSAFMGAALAEQDFLCRTFGKCVIGDPIDREIGNMIGKRGPTAEKLFTYARYNVELTRPALDAMGLHDIEPKKVQSLDSYENAGDLQRVGVKTAEKVTLEPFADFLA
jgi:patatin-like phospholipase/acyl hydrolase